MRTSPHRRGTAPRSPLASLEARTAHYRPQASAGCRVAAGAFGSVSPLAPRAGCRRQDRSSWLRSGLHRKRVALVARKIDHHILDGGEFEQAFLAALAAEATVLHAAERPLPGQRA